MKVTAQEFNLEFTNLNQQERGIVRETVEMIAYCIKRKFYAELGYSSAQGWLMKEHGYPKSCAYRRIEAAKLVTSVPDAIERLEPVSATETRMNLIFDEEQMAILERVREITGHSHFNASWSELLIVAAREFLKHNDPIQKVERSIKRAEAKLAKDSDLERSQKRVEQSSGAELSATSDEQSSAPVLASLVSPQLRAAVIYRDSGRCTYRDLITGHRCDSRHNLEIDHIIPRALGGTNEPENLQTLCREHNQHKARIQFGAKFIASRVTNARRGATPNAWSRSNP